MEHGQLDALARTMGDVGTRRAILGLLAAGSLGRMATRLGLDASAAAKSKKHTAKENKKESKKRRPRPERKAAGSLQAERKRKKKRPKKPPVVPEELCSLDTYRCPDGTCMPWDQCCAGEKRCSSSSSRRCIPSDQCCSDERSCSGDDTCVAAGKCCPAERKCADGECYPADGCCPKEKQCVGGGHCYPADYCCPGERECPDGACAPAGACCPGEKQCFPGAPCVSASYCCYSEQPECGFCKRLACENGSWVCQELREECPGGEWDPARCRCKYCEETCDPVTKLCHSNCPDGHQCVEGTCHRVCTNPSKPKLCCKENRPGWVECSCGPANAKCYPCEWATGACWCLPGQTCCSLEASFCPQECLEAEICQR
jgi:hypothetical protein